MIVVYDGTNYWQIAYIGRNQFSATDNRWYSTMVLPTPDYVKNPEDEAFCKMIIAWCMQ